MTRRRPIFRLINSLARIRLVIVRGHTPMRRAASAMPTARTSPSITAYAPLCFTVHKYYTIMLDILASVCYPAYVETKQIASLFRDVANLYPDNEAAARKIQSKWPDLVPEVSKFDLPPVESVFAAAWPEGSKQLSALGQLTRSLCFGLVPEADWKAQQILFPTDGRQRVSVDWKYRKITYTPLTTVEKLIYFLMQHGDRIKRCANIECTRPFFVAKQPNEHYCSDVCAKNVQRLAKRNWWKESGKAWRKSQKSRREK
jgi:hypothetical protein